MPLYAVYLFSILFLKGIEWYKPCKCVWVGKKSMSYRSIDKFCHQNNGCQDGHNEGNWSYDNVKMCNLQCHQTKQQEKEWENKNSNPNNQMQSYHSHCGSQMTTCNFQRQSCQQNPIVLSNIMQLFIWADVVVKQQDITASQHA